LADTKLRELRNLREKLDVIIVPPWGGGRGGATGGGLLSSLIQGLPLRGPPLPWQNSAETPNLVATGLSSADDIRGGLGYAGLANLEKFVADGGLLITAGGSAALPIQGGMTELVGLSEPRNLQVPGSVLLTQVEDRSSPIAYGYDDKLLV